MGKRRYPFGEHVIKGILELVILGSAFKVVADMPQDAKLVGFYHSWDSQCFYLVIESDQFPEVEEGQDIPLGPPCQWSVFEPAGDDVGRWMA